MARITVEDCIKKIRNQYDLVILAKERTVQLGRGAAPAVDPEDDKKPVIALREIGESKIASEELEESIINKLRQIPDYQEEEELEEVDNDTFRQSYQGGLSKSEMEKSATRKFTARIPKIDTKPSKEIDEENINTESQSPPSIDDTLETQSGMKDIQEDTIPTEENLEASINNEVSEDEEVSDNEDVTEANQLSEDITEISSPEELSVEDDTAKED